MKDHVRLVSRSPPAFRARLAVLRLEDRTVPGRLAGEGISHDPHDWPMFGHDPSGSRHNPAEHRLRPGNVYDLGVRWRFPTDGAVAGTPAVVDDVVYAADSTGSVYAVGRDGDPKWKTTLAIPSLLGVKFATSPIVTDRTVLTGDMTRATHGLDVETGAPRWKVTPNPHPFAAVFGNGTMVGRDVAFGTSSYELLLPAIDPTYTNFTFRGSVVLLDPTDGRVVWQTFTIRSPSPARQ